MRIEVTLDSGRQVVQDWALEKLAFYILSSDVPHPKFESAQAMEWVPNYIMAAKWDKNLITKGDYERIVSKWPKDTPKPINRAHIDGLRIVADLNGSPFGCGLSRIDSPELFEEILDYAVPRAKYSQYDYGTGETIFESRAPGKYISDIERVFGFDHQHDLDQLHDVECRAILIEPPHRSFEPPFRFVMQEEAL
jgi:hypothetical protein